MEDEANRLAIIAEAKVALLASTPAEPQELKFWILQVLGRYRDFNSQDQRMKASILSDWMQIFGDYPIDILDRARLAWLKSPRCSYMPQEGDIIAQISEADSLRVYYRDAAKRIAEQEWFR